MMKINIKDFEDEYFYIKPDQVRQNINGRIVLITHSEYERLINAIQIKRHNLNDEDQFQFRAVYNGIRVVEWMIMTDFRYLLIAALDVYPLLLIYVKRWRCSGF